MRAGLIAALILSLAIPAVAEQPILVVALFRHGIRAPLEDFGKTTGNKHSGKPWPTPDQWGAEDWGDVTDHGIRVIKKIGSAYVARYGPQRSYFWADSDGRTIDTANALACAFPSATVRHLTEKEVDPLFHPFKAQCGHPDIEKLDDRAQALRARTSDEIRVNEKRFEKLYDALKCPANSPNCTPLSSVAETVKACPSPADCGSPITWTGQFSYASSASEAFLLEYVNNEPAMAWGNTTLADVKFMLQLHETFFDETQREGYVAQIEASNLLREILDLLNRRAGIPVRGCPHAGTQPFVGLVGHDTNLAGVGSLLGLRWRFPDDFGIPVNDALPAGALVFELYGARDHYHVKIVYATASLDDMKKPSDTLRLVAIPVAEMSLGDLSRKINDGINEKFFSQCRGGMQFCGLVP